MSLVLIEQTDSIATLTLNRPERHNSLTPELLNDFLLALYDVANARALILRANGRSFSTGGDVRAFYDHRADAATYAREIVGLLNQTIEALLKFPAPTIAAVNGLVTGGSIGLVLACDLIIVSPQASFTPYYNVVGFSPDGGWTALLPSVIGYAKAAESLLTNATISAQQAVEWGLANRAVEADRVYDEAQAAAESIVPMKINSVRRSIQLLRDHKLAAMPQLQAELQQFVEQIVTPEAQNGMREFLKES
ncbi:MAG: enoyl-CoA hydratase/isomerase family protein [Thermoflexales bacterium]|nr:enoyl-CoA hydratase/isomerase family protein [Thermoflexales bacterium]